MQQWPLNIRDETMQSSKQLPLETQSSNPEIQNNNRYFNSFWQWIDKTKQVIYESYQTGLLEDFLFSVKRGDMSRVIAAIQKGVNVNCTTSDFKEFALLMATRQRNARLVHVLLDAGAHIEVKDSSGRTPLMLAIEQGDMNLVEAFLLSNANIEARDKKGRTPLMLAIKHDRFRIADLLLRHRADTEARNNKGHTPLIYAAKVDKLIPSFVEILIERNAKWDTRASHGNTVLMKAMNKKNTAAFMALMAIRPENSNLDMKNDRGETALFSAVYAKDKVAIALLIEGGANIEAKDNEGNTPLFHAAKLGFVEGVEKLLESGANVNARNNLGETVLMMLLAGVRNVYLTFQILKLLLSHGVDRGAQNNKGETAGSMAGEYFKKNYTLLFWLFCSDDASHFFHDRLEKIKFSGEIPESLTCPISKKLLEDPVTISGGKTYSRSSLIDLFLKNKEYHESRRWGDNFIFCPVTGQIIKEDVLVNDADLNMKLHLETFVAKQEKKAMKKGSSSIKRKTDVEEEQKERIDEIRPKFI